MIFVTDFGAPLPIEGHPTLNQLPRFAMWSDESGRPQVVSTFDEKPRGMDHVPTFVIGQFGAKPAPDGQ